MHRPWRASSIKARKRASLPPMSATSGIRSLSEACAMGNRPEMIAVTARAPSARGSARDKVRISQGWWPGRLVQILSIGQGVRSICEISPTRLAKFGVGTVERDELRASARLRHLGCWSAMLSWRPSRCTARRTAAQRLRCCIKSRSRSDR